MNRLRALMLPVAACIVAIVVAAGCHAGGDEPTGSASPAPTVTPAAGSVSVQQLTFVPPDGLDDVTGTKKQRNDNASHELLGASEDGAPAPALDVFVERGDVGPLKARTTAVVNMLNLQAQDVEFVRNERVEVPGAQAAQVVETTFTCTGDGNEEIPCRQLDLLVQMPGKPQYTLRYGMPESEYSKSALDGLVSSVRVVR